MMEKKALLYKRFLVEAENKEENFITEHPKSQLEMSQQIIVLSLN
jgi:topoisomerase-4 subunit A